MFVKFWDIWCFWLKKVFFRIFFEFFLEEIMFVYKICVFFFEVREDIFCIDVY